MRLRVSEALQKDAGRRDRHGMLEQKGHGECSAERSEGVMEPVRLLPQRQVQGPRTGAIPQVVKVP